MITVQTIVTSSIEKVWEYWTNPEHITGWNHASDDWHCPDAENDLKPGGKFRYTMAAKDGSMSFDFEGTYAEVVEKERIFFTLADERKVWVYFKVLGEAVEITETFEAETINSEELQQAGWQAILDNFRRYTEKQGDLPYSHK
ncbi:MAG: SRPBCC family protein [Bacteroidales bacterium]|nr:SRPBCC family protein [Bacteroidales bacterium]